MNDAQLLAYIESAAVLLKLPMNDARAQRVAVNFRRTAAMAAMLQAVPLEAHDELAQIYCPADFPATDPDQP